MAQAVHIRENFFSLPDFGEGRGGAFSTAQDLVKQTPP
jgi:hypothetical protein